MKREDAIGMVIGAVIASVFLVGLAIAANFEGRTTDEKEDEVLELIYKTRNVVKLCDRDTGNLIYIRRHHSGGMTVVENGCQKAVDY